MTLFRRKHIDIDVESLCKVANEVYLVDPGVKPIEKGR
jgi:hypothetical protein